MEFGEKLKQLRKANHLSQEKLSERIHVSRQAISKWEQGSAIPDTDNIVLLSKFFQVPIEYLLLNDEEIKDSHEHKNLVIKESVLPKGRVITFIVGIVLEMIAVIAAYLLQYQEKIVYDSYNTYPLDYLKEVPLNILVLIGGGLLFYAIYPLVIKFFDLVKRNLKVY